MPDALANVRVLIDRGIEAIQAGDGNLAVNELQTAFDRLGDVADRKSRRDKYALLGTLFIRLQAGERALAAARAAVELDEALGDRNLLGQDILMCGTAIGTLGNHEGAVAAYRDARRIFLEDENWANAASATTNIAIIEGQNDIDAGIEMLEESLGYLARQPFPDTEITTRIALVQALVVAERPPQRVFEVAADLFRKFWDELRPDQRENSVGPLDIAIERHLAAHRVADPAAWKRNKFPEAYG